MTEDHPTTPDPAPTEERPPLPPGPSPAAMRGVGAAVLGMEALVLLMAIAPLRMLGGFLSGYGIAAIVILAVACIACAAMLRRPWVWYAALVVQALVMLTGVAQLAITVIGVIFAAIWLYVLHARRLFARRAALYKQRESD